MSLGIFSFDLAAIINRLANLIETPAPLLPPAEGEVSLERTEDVLQETAETVDEAIDDALMAAALATTVTSIIMATETVKKETSREKTTTAAAAAQPRPKPAQLDEETRREIERLIRSLQTSVIHNYKSTDIIDEAVSLRRIANFPQRTLADDPPDKREAAERQRKTEEQKLEMLREKLKKEILRNNRSV